MEPEPPSYPVPNPFSLVSIHQVSHPPAEGLAGDPPDHSADVGCTGPRAEN